MTDGDGWFLFGTVGSRVRTYGYFVTPTITPRLGNGLENAEEKKKKKERRKTSCDDLVVELVTAQQCGSRQAHGQDGTLRHRWGLLDRFAHQLFLSTRYLHTSELAVAISSTILTVTH